MSLFSDYASQLVDKTTAAYSPISEVDAFEFITSSNYLGETPTPFQRLTLKTLYNLWDKYGVDEEEEQLIQLLKNKWRINIDINNPNPITNLVLVLGRRSTKSTTMSFLATYALYSLICKGNPQAFYGIRDRHPIQIVHIASASKQAEAVFTLTANNIRKVDFFKDYIDFEKDTSSELRLYTPYDLHLNERIKLYNRTRQKGKPRESLLPGSLYAKSIATSAASSRGDAIYMLMLSEFAHLTRAKLGESEMVGSENPQTDYAIYKALSPSVKDFGHAGKVICESSPLEKGGEFYYQYCLGGGVEQENFDECEPLKGYQVIQLATYEARPTITRIDLEGDYRKDPAGAEMEYGAHFGNPSGSFISEELIAAVPVPNMPLVRYNPGPCKYIICLDPGGKAKKKEADTYAVAWGHVDWSGDEKTSTYWIDGMHGFDAALVADGAGRYTKVPVDPNTVLDFVIKLIQDLGGRNYIIEIAFDQWNSASSISTLQSLHFPAIETTFTNPYKADMYANFLQKMENNQVKCYGEDIGGYVSRWALEMKYLQRRISGKYVFYGHPTSGPVQHDDYATVTSNLVYRLALQATPTIESRKDAVRFGQRPVTRHSVKPVRGPRLR